MITLHADVENNHYFYVMAWKTEKKINAPNEKKKFDIYSKALKYYNDLVKKYETVIIYEYIGGKRKIAKTTEEK